MGVKSEAQGNPWVSDLVGDDQRCLAGLVLLNQPAPSHVGCTRRVRALPASISFTKKEERSTILAEKTHPTPNSKTFVALKKTALKFKHLGWLHHLQTKQENSSSTASHLFQKNLSGEAFKLWNRWLGAFGAAWGGKEPCSHGCSPFPDPSLAPQFGDSQQLRLVRILRSTVMVRVGGGWMALDEFLVKNDPCRGKA